MLYLVHSNLKKCLFNNGHKINGYCCGRLSNIFKFSGFASFNAVPSKFLAFASSLRFGSDSSSVFLKETRSTIESIGGRGSFGFEEDFGVSWTFGVVGLVFSVVKTLLAFVDGGLVMLTSSSVFMLLIVV